VERSPVGLSPSLAGREGGGAGGFARELISVDLQCVFRLCDFSQSLHLHSAVQLLYLGGLEISI
jgi:hypothetical protein